MAIRFNCDCGTELTVPDDPDGVEPPLWKTLKPEVAKAITELG